MKKLIVSQPEENLTSHEVVGRENKTKLYLGVDVSKGSIDACLLPSNQTWHVATDDASLESWARELPGSISLVVMEATGGLELSVAAALGSRQFPVAIVNPLRASKFAKALNYRGKTDKIDAHVLALFAERMQPDAHPLPTEKQLEFNEVLSRRRQLVEMITAEENRLKQARGEKVRAHIRAHIAWMKGQKADCEAELGGLIDANPVWSEREELFRSVPGVGPITARTLIAEMPELGTLNGKAAAALTGLAPFPRESGKWFGKRFCSGGRAIVRTALHMATLSAIRCNAPIQEFYNRLVQHGKPHKVAMTACMRKLLGIINAMAKQKKKWETVHKNA